MRLNGGPSCGGRLCHRYSVVVEGRRDRAGRLGERGLAECANTQTDDTPVHRSAWGRRANAASNNMRNGTPGKGRTRRDETAFRRDAIRPAANNRVVAMIVSVRPFNTCTVDVCYSFGVGF